MLPPALVGKFDRGSFVCSDWELRITNRCLEEDLGRRAGTAMADLQGIEIVNALITERRNKATDTRQVSPLTCGQQVWVLSRGHDHRGGTFFDEQERVIWLVAYRVHRSGSEDDFFPYCKNLDRQDRLLPDEADYERLIRDRDQRFCTSCFDRSAIDPEKGSRTKGGDYGDVGRQVRRLHRDRARRRC